jgi:hypothetical protein
MKKILLLLAIPFFVGITGCSREDKTLRDDVKIADKPSHCYDQEMSGNEYGPDCGGDCNPCENITPDCTINKNTVELDGQLYDAEIISCGKTNKGYLFRLKFGNQSVDLLVYDFNLSNTYKLVMSDSFTSGSDAYAVLNSPNLGALPASSGQGKIFLGLDETGKKYIVACGLNFRYWPNQKDFSFSAKVYCN